MRILLALLGVALFAPAPAAAAPVARVSTDRWDLGGVEIGAEYRTEVVVSNAGDEPLIITGIRRAADAPLTYEIRRGEGLEPHTIELVLQPRDLAAGPQERPFVIRTNDPLMPDHELTLRWEVLPPRYNFVFWLGEKSARTRLFYEKVAKLQPGKGLLLSWLDLDQDAPYADFLRVEAQLDLRLAAPLGMAVLLGPGAGEGAIEGALLDREAVLARLDALLAAAGEDGRLDADEAAAHLGGLSRGARRMVLSAPAVLGPDQFQQAPARGLGYLWIALVACAVLVALVFLFRVFSGRRVRGAALLVLVPAACCLLPDLLRAQEGAREAGPGAATGDYAVSVFATGGTEGALEVCGCSTGQLGGVSRRSFFLFRVRNEVDWPLVVDAGGWIPELSDKDERSMGMGGGELDRIAVLQARTNLLALAGMGYDAVNVSAGDLRIGRPMLQGLARQVPFVSSDLAVIEVPPPWPPFRVRRHGERAVAILGLSGLSSADAPPGFAVKNPSTALREALDALPPEVRRVVLLSGFPRETNRSLAALHPRIDLVVEAGDREPSVEKAGAALIVSTSSKGQHLIRADLPDEAGERRARRVPISESLQEDPNLQPLLAGFYEEVKGISLGGDQLVLPRPPLFPENLETMWNGYVGSAACRSCHPAEFEQWQGTRHASAYPTLQRVNRYFVPKCIQCHTVGYGSPTGFRLVPEPTRHLEGVGCESCHGPGGLHARRPSKRNTLKTVSLDHCAKCHDPENHPQFEERKQGMLPLVDHRTPPGLVPGEEPMEDYIRERLAAASDEDPLEVELYVMALCPFGTDAELGVADLKRRFGRKLDVRLHFIARAKGLEVQVDPTKRFQGETQRQGCSSAGIEETDDPNAKFTSLHGSAEVTEGIRQVVIQRHFPEALWPYLEHRNPRYQSPDWRPSAEAAGIDPERLESLVAVEGDALFRADIRHALERGLLHSPTVVVDGRYYRGRADQADVIRLFCGQEFRQEACEDLPACASDVDCAKPGQVGVCVDPGTPQARCVWTEPVPVALTVINASRCPSCDTANIVEQNLGLFPGLRIRDLEFDSPEAAPYLEAFGIRELPAYILGPEVEQAARFDKVKDYVDQGELGYRLRQGPDTVDYRIGEPWARVDPPEWIAPRDSAPGQAWELALRLSNAGEGTLALDPDLGARTLSPDLVKLAVESVEGEDPSWLIRVRLTAPSEPGPFEYLVFLHTNDPLHPWRRVNLRGFVPPE